LNEPARCIAICSEGRQPKLFRTAGLYLQLNSTISKPTGQSPSEGNRHPASQIFPSILRTQMLNVYKNKQLIPILNRMNPATPLHSIDLRSILILSSHLGLGFSSALMNPSHTRMLRHDCSTDRSVFWPFLTATNRWEDSFGTSSITDNLPNVTGLEANKRCAF
jgi:hypothetical protein